MWSHFSAFFDFQDLNPSEDCRSVLWGFICVCFLEASLIWVCLLWNGVFPAISVKKMVSHSSAMAAITDVIWWSLRELRKERIPAIWEPSDCSHSLQRWALRKLRVWKHRILAPDSWGAYQRNDFSEPRLLHLPIHRKALNSLTWDIWFPLINNNLLMFRLPALSCKTSI